MVARKVDRQRWRRSIVSHLADFPRQYAALSTAMGGFAADFGLKEFKDGFDTTEDMEAYNRVQAVERAAGRVQNYVAELAEAGAKLAELLHPPIEGQGSRAEQAFEALRDAGVVQRGLCRRLTQAQGARTRIEHGYVHTPAGDVHRAIRLIHQGAREFIGPYRVWIEPYLDPSDS